MTKSIEVGRAEGVQTLRMNRPDKKNALTSEMYRAMSDALTDGDKSQDVAAHVFLGVEGAFTAGNDISDFLKVAMATPDAGGGNSPSPDENTAEIFRFISLLPRVAKPMVAAVDGLAIGIGTTLLFHCDLVYASNRSQFATPFLDLGLVPEAASSLTMPARMGYARAFEMLVLGEPFSAQRMLDAGAVNEVVSPEEVEERAIAAARRLALKPREALTIARRLMRPDQQALCEQTEVEAKAFLKRLGSSEARKAFQTFLARK